MRVWTTGFAIAFAANSIVVAQTPRAAPSRAPHPLVGYWCTGTSSVSMRTRVVSVDDKKIVTVSTSKPGETAVSVADDVVSFSPQRVTIRDAKNREQTLQIDVADMLQVTQGKGKATLRRCDGLGADVYMTQFKVLSLDNFGPPECAAFDAARAVFTMDANVKHTGSMSGKLFGGGLQARSYCRILPISAGKLRPAMSQAVAAAGLPIATFNETSGVYNTDLVSSVDNTATFLMAMPFREKFSISVLPQGANASRVTITRQVEIQPPKTQWSTVSSDGWKEHYLMTEALLIATQPQ